MDKTMNRKAALESRPRIDGVAGDDASVRSTLAIGIDLGTSRAAISAGNGSRKFVESLVGWPKDALAARYHQTPILFGRAALENRLSLRVYRPLEKGVLKAEVGGSSSLAEEFLSDPEGNQRAAKELLHHLVSLADPRREERLHGVLAVPAQASVESKKALLDLASEYLDRVLVVSQPFAVAYGIGALDGALIVDIGAGTTDLCRMHGSLPAAGDQVTIGIAGDSVDEELLKRIRARHPRAQVTVTMAKDLKERLSNLVDGRDKIVARVPVDGVPAEIDVTEEIRAACGILVDPIVEAVRGLISSYHPEFQDRLRGNIVLSGGGSLVPGLASRIEAKLSGFGGGKVSCVPDPLFAGADGALRLAADMPVEYWDRVG
ncbi:MAG: rod shape-determining protein [Planctomycetes bacterium]|nr:rod shape-determining protein [Planctomycetota bacterium]